MINYSINSNNLNIKIHLKLKKMIKVLYRMISCLIKSIIYIEIDYYINDSIQIVHLEH
ncbi:putative protein of GPI synthesis [Candida albicans P60002]|nr:putative protein of GPI synthesis [Candida albicans P60002]